MSKTWEAIVWFGKNIFGCLLFALGFNLFLSPNDLNAGGISGLAMIFATV